MMSDNNNLIKIIDSSEGLTTQDSFNVAVKCSSLLAGSNEQVALARQIVIHILNNWTYVPVETQLIWADIVESVGFYPYLEKNAETMKLQSLSDEVRQKTHLSDYLPSTYLHKEQKELSRYLLSGKNVIASANEFWKKFAN